MNSGEPDKNQYLDGELTAIDQSGADGTLTQRMLNGSQDCFMVLSLEGSLRWGNRAARHLFINDENAPVPERQWDAWWTDEARQPAQAALAQARAGGVGRFQGFDTTSAGKPRWWDAMVTPILDDQGHPEGLLATLRDMSEEHQAQEAMARLKWLLRPQYAPERAQEVIQPYGDLTPLNNCRLILDTVGEPMLRQIAADYMDLLETSTAIYERNGDYAMGMVNSGWCRFLDQASRCRCQTEANHEALGCGQWICHECCWRQSAQQAIETGAPVDIECAGGIRLYALPIKAGEQVVGAINFGYGDPPKDPGELQRIAQIYGVDAAELRREAEKYESRPPYLIELAKRRLVTSAHLIGEIVRRKQAENDRQSSELAYREVFESASDVILMLDAQGRIIDINPYAVRLTGYSREELLGRDLLHDLVLFEDQEKIIAVFHGLLQGQRQHYEVRWRAKDGRILWFEGISTACLNESGIFRNTRCILRDVTERKRADDALRESEARFRAIFNQAAIGIAMADLEGRYVMINQRYCEILGRPAQEVLGRTPSDFTCPEDVSASKDQLNALHRREVDYYTFSKRYFRPDGSLIWCQVTVSGIFDEDQHLRYTLGVVEDINERKQAEDALLRFRNALDSAVDNIFLVDPETIRFIDVNQSACDTLGYTREELLQMGPPEVVPTASREFLRDEFKHYIPTQQRWRVESVHRRKDGTLFDMEVQLRPIQNPDGKTIIVAVARDISERKHYEEALRGIVEGTSQATGEEFFRNLVQHLAQTLGVCCAMVAEVDKFNPERARTLAMWNNGQFIDNTEYSLYGTPCANVINQKNCYYYNKVADLFPQDHLLREMGAESYVGTPLRDSAGRVVGLMAILHQQPLPESALAESMLKIFSARAATELERMQAERELSDASRRKDEFLAMLGHELRNPLAPIRNTVFLLQQVRDPLGPRVERGLAVISRQTEHLTRLVDDLLDMARISRGAVELKKQRTNLAEAITRAVEMSTPVIENKGHTLTTILPPRSIYMNADPVRLTQVFGNLLDNAAKYTEAGGTITLSTTIEGSEAVIRVQDTGIGIDPEMQGHVFDLFAQGHRTLDRAQGGLGLGLTLVRQLCQMHGGSVTVHSAGPGQGSEFTVRLPVEAEATAQSELARMNAGEPEKEKGGLRRVLVVDDVVDTAQSLAELIRLWNFEVDVALDGPTALDAACRIQPDVVLLDIGLPGLNGYEVARRIRQEPSIASTCLVALTGYGQDENRKAAMEAGFNYHLVKPVDLSELRHLLERSPVSR